MIKWHSKTKKWYVNKGYKFTKMNDEFEAKVEDLSDGSNVFVTVECDGCKNIIDIKYQNYKLNVKNDGIYYCGKCATCLSTIGRTWIPISESHPDLIKYFVNEDDAKCYSYSSNAKINLKCPDCGYIKPKKIADFTNKGFACNKCGDGISYPEKFMTNMLSQLNIDIILQKSFKWSGNKIYDYYIPKLNWIVETHGRQHYEQTGRKGGRSRTLQEEKINDEIKYNLAIKYNITKYIIIDCRESNMEWIKNSIMHSELKNLNLNMINWEECDKYASSNILKNICICWNNGEINVNELANKFKISRSSVWLYLSKGSGLGFCNYNGKENAKRARREGKQGTKKVICITTGEIFNSLKDASEKYKISSGHMSHCCSGERRSSGKHPITNEPLKWQYYDEYIKLQKQINT